ALIVQAIANTRGKIAIINGAGAQRLSEEACTATSVHYAYTTRAVANTVGAALIEHGDDTWYFITVDYSFGYDLETDTADVVKSHGGKILGEALHPLGAKDFVSYLSRAQASGA